MRVSVVIPTYNSGPLVVEAVQSVLAQTRAADEILVIDDGSTDDTTACLTPFGSRIRIIHKANGGVSTARNRGVAEATGDVIAFLDADDVWHPRKLELQLPKFVSRPELGLLGAMTYDWPGSHPELADAVPEPTLVALQDLVVRNYFSTSTVVARREVLLSVGEFDVEQFGTEDYDLWLRIAQRTVVANVPITLSGYRIATPGSLSKNAARMEAGMRLILEKLEVAGVFRRRPLLRRKAWGYFHYSCGYMQAVASSRCEARAHLYQSLIRYPLAYGRTFVRYPFGRIRLLVDLLRNAKTQQVSVS